MPAKRIWTDAEVLRLREVNGTISSDVLAREIGCCRWVILQKERVIGIVRPERKRADKPRPSRSLYYATTPFPRDENPLPAGHPETWQLLMRNTPCLDGAPFA